MPSFKLFSDPVHGFITVPVDLVLDLVQSPEVQRLRRIRQLGVGNLVFPGAEHTRFGHALGAMALMQDALASLCDGGTPISTEENVAAQVVALLHDIGHGPFSHTLEHNLISGFHHEDMSRALLVDLNERFGGRLSLALRMFDGDYERPFFHQLISSQLDMDRLDYLRRDSFFTGVVEGEVGVQRIIKTLRVHPVEGGPGSQLAVESKGIYAVENYLISRRLMYWQVYLHKTVLAGDQLLRAILRRLRNHASESIFRQGSRALAFFLQRELTLKDVADPAVRRAFCDLDDTDVLYSMKQWMHANDPILADLCRRFIERDFFRVTFLNEEPGEDLLQLWREEVASWLVAEGLSTGDTAYEDAGYYVAADHSKHRAYGMAEEPICVIGRDGVLRELSKMTEAAAVDSLAHSVVKPYISYPKDVLAIAV